MDLEGALAALRQLRLGRSRGVVAVHQPVTLVWAASRSTRGEPRLVRWRDARAGLAEAIGAVAGGGQGAPEYPVLALRSSPLWELEHADDAPAAHGSQAQRWLERTNPRFGLSAPAYLLLQNVGARDRFAGAAAAALDPLHADALLRWFEIDAPVFRGFGAAPGVEEGELFEDRAALSRAKVHRARQAGIVGTAATGAESIVVSGGYEDDEDYGDLIIYTGHGGNDSNTGHQIADQDPSAPGNAALITSHLTGAPVRVVRGPAPRNPHAPSRSYRYEGLYRVERYWMEQGRRGYQICRYRMIRIGIEAPAALYLPDADKAGQQLPQGDVTPSRNAAVSNRITRSVAMAEAIKRLYDYTCQTCDTRLVINGRGYAEAAHIRPLGRPHDGPDTSDNLVCLCANCHVLFDNGAIFIEDDHTISSQHPNRGRLRLAGNHRLSQTYLAYHRGMYRR